MKNSIKRIQSESLLSTLLSARILREANALKYIALAAMAISFAACEQEDFTPAVQGDPDAVRINATIGNLQTRVAYSGENGVTSFSSGDAIKVVNSLRTSKNEATYTTADGTNWTTTDAMVWNSSSKNQFNAYYPVADYSSFESFTIPEDQSSEAKLALADWMTAKTDEIDKPESGVLNLNFEHCLAKVTVNLTFGLQYPEGSQSVSDFTFYTNDATPRAITPLENSETSYTAILRPGGYAEGTNFITLTMNDVDEHYVYGQTTSPDGVSKTAINIEAGKHYTFTLKVGKDKVSLSSVNVVGWDVKEIEGGVAEEAPCASFIDGTTLTLKVLEEATSDDITSEVAKALNAGCTTLDITLPADAGVDMFQGIVAALAADGIAAGSIDLTISGATTVPENAIVDMVYEGTLPALRSITLPDVTEMKGDAIYYCENLISVSAPKCEILGNGAISDNVSLTSVYLPVARIIGFNETSSVYGVFANCTSLTEISLPEATHLGPYAFNTCTSLKTVYCPKVTEVWRGAFWNCTSIEKITLGALTTADEGNGGVFRLVTTTNIDLVLSPYQKAMNYDSSTEIHTAGTDAFDFTSTDFIGYTFKSITAQQ